MKAHPACWTKHTNFVLSALFILGCSEPYPGWTVEYSDYDSFPKVVKQSFEQEHPSAKIATVEKSTFESRASSRPRKYRIFFDENTKGRQRVIYDEKGRRADQFDFWFDLAAQRRKPQ